MVAFLIPSQQLQAPQEAPVPPRNPTLECTRLALTSYKRLAAEVTGVA